MIKKLLLLFYRYKVIALKAGNPANFFDSLHYTGFSDFPLVVVYVSVFMPGAQKQVSAFAE